MSPAGLTLAILSVVALAGAQQTAEVYNDNGDLYLEPFPTSSGSVHVRGSLVIDETGDVAAKFAQVDSRLDALESTTPAAATTTTSSGFLVSSSNCSRCDVNAECFNTRGGLGTVCSCAAGYRGNGLACYAINHCADASHSCPTYASCIYQGPGTFTCACDSGYLPGSATVCLPNNLTERVQFNSAVSLDVASHPFPFFGSPGGEFGRSMADLGDVDGDLVNDIAIGAPGEDGGEGNIYIAFMQRNGAYKSVVKLNVTCPTASCGLGFDLVGLPDLNLDGVPDLIIGSSINVVFVVFLRHDGSAASVVELTRESIAAQVNMAPGALFTSHLLSDWGTSVAYIGDRDNDGNPTIGIGQPSISGKGHAYLIELNSTAHVVAVPFDLIADPFFSLSNDDRGGLSMVGIGDIDNDGIPDVAFTSRISLFILSLDTEGILGMSSYFSSAFGSAIGENWHRTVRRLAKGYLGLTPKQGDGTNVYIGFVSSSRAVQSFTKVNLPYPYDVSVLSSDYSSGVSVTGLGDLEGDGTPNLLVGHFQCQAGNSGGAIGTGFGCVQQINMDSLATGAVKAIQTLGPASGSLNQSSDAVASGLGSSIAAIGDLDGDGYDDIVVGASSHTGFAALALILLSPTRTAKTVAWISSETLTSAAPTSQDDFGAAVCVLSRLSFVETEPYSSNWHATYRRGLAIGAPRTSGGGVIYIARVPRSGDTMRLVATITPGDAGLTSGEDMFFGASLATVGFLDDDNVEEVAVGAPLYDTGRGAVAILYMTSAGAVFSSTILSATQGQFRSALWANAHFGASLAAIDDLNNDGVADLAVGAYNEASIKTGFFVVFLNVTGESIGEQEHTNSVGGLERYGLGSHVVGAAMAALPDADGDGIDDLLLGMPNQQDMGAIAVCFMARDGTVRSMTFPPLNSAEPITGPRFGASVAVGQLIDSTSRRVYAGTPSGPYGRFTTGNLSIVT